MLRILAVDDEATIAAIMRRVLTRAGHRVAVASSGAEALALAGSQSFDIAIIDYLIPEPNGLEVSKAIGHMQPACLRILCSGRLDLPLVLDAVNSSEVSRVLTKPFGPQELLAAIDDVVQQRRRLVDGEIEARSNSAQTERRQLLDCLAGDTLRLAVQPIVTASDAHPVAFEALLRSSHPVLNNPCRVLEAAERHHMIEQVGRVVVECAAAWMERLPVDTKLFINLHPDELRHPHRLANRLEALMPWAERVVLEITERSSIFELDTWQEATTLLPQLGFGIAVDDLGSGYSALNMLAALQPHYIKVDMSIVRDVDADLRKQRLIELLSRFAAATRAKLIAEGVETAREAATLRDLGVDLLQGYYYGRPDFELTTERAA